MTIKRKLTLNVLIMIVIVTATSFTSIIGMGFVKKNLDDLLKEFGF